MRRITAGRVMSTVWRYGVTNPEVSICIPTWDRDHPRVDKAIQAIRAHTLHVDYEIVILDCERELRGYTRPQNEAMAQARGEFLVAMNDDVEVCAGWIDPLLLKSYEVSAWCVTPDRTATDGPQVFAPYCMMWSRGDWEEMGGLDEQFVFWCSDIDLARRLVDLGRPPIRVKLPGEGIRHALNATASSFPELNEICQQDLARFRAKWHVGAEDEKHRLAALCVA